MASFFPTSNADFFAPSTSNLSAKPTPEIFDPFFGIKVLCPKFSLDVFNTYCETLKKIKLSSAAPNSITDDSVLMGVVVDTTGLKKSSNDKEYLVWKLADLQSDKVVKILMFGDAASTHWKVQTGFVVAITNPALAENDGQTQLLTLKIAKAIQVLIFGLCPDYGTCKSLTKSGQRCSNYVNVTYTLMCPYHIQNEARKLRSTRGAFSAASNEIPKCNSFKSPKKSQPPGVVTMKRPGNANTTTVRYNLGDRAAVAAKAKFGQRNMQRLAEMEKEKENLEQSAKSATQQSSNLRDFLNKRTKEDQIRDAARRAGVPQLGRSVQRGEFADLTSPQKIVRKNSFTPKELAAREKAAAILKRSAESPNPLKRKAPTTTHSEPEPSSSKQKMPKFSKEQIMAMLQKKSSHEEEIEKVNNERLGGYFKIKEAEEKVESYATSLMEIRDFNVVSCKECKYTAKSQAQRCVELNHEIIRHKATKRFFKCRDCGQRTTSFAMLPTIPCTGCSNRNWDRVAMRDERRIKIREDLLVRGEERKFVNH